MTERLEAASIFWHRTANYYDVNYRSLGRPPISLWSIAWRSSVYVTKARGTSTRLDLSHR